MPAKTEPRSGLQYGWNFGESGWNTGMDNNLLYIGRFGFHLSVLSAAFNSPPGSPADGDAYIVAASPTGAWSGRANQIAVYVGGSPGNWVFATPRNGWRSFNEATNSSFIFNENVWTEESSGGGAVDSVNGQTGVVVLDAADIEGAVADDDSRLTNARDWTATVISQAEAEAGTATTPRKWTAQRVAQAIAAQAGGGGGGIPDAPSDGQLYGRRNAAWEIVAGGGSLEPASIVKIQPFVYQDLYTDAGITVRWEFVSRDGKRVWRLFQLADSSGDRLGYYDQTGAYHFVIDLPLNIINGYCENEDGTGVIVGYQPGTDYEFVEITEAGVNPLFTVSGASNNGFGLIGCAFGAGKVFYNVLDGSFAWHFYKADFDGSNTEELTMPPGATNFFIGGIGCIGDDASYIGTCTVSGISTLFYASPSLAFSILDTAEAGTYISFIGATSDASAVLAQREIGGGASYEYICVTDMTSVEIISIPSEFTNYYSGGIANSGDDIFLALGDGSGNKELFYAYNFEVVRISTMVPGVLNGTDSTLNFISLCNTNQLIVTKNPVSSGGGVAGNDGEFLFNDGGELAGAETWKYDHPNGPVQGDITEDGSSVISKTEYTVIGGSQKIKMTHDETPGGGSTVNDLVLENNFGYGNLLFTSTEDGSNFSTLEISNQQNSMAKIALAHSNSSGQQSSVDIKAQGNSSTGIDIKNTAQNAFASLLANPFSPSFDISLLGSWSYRIQGQANPGGAYLHAKEDSSGKRAMIGVNSFANYLQLDLPATPASSSAAGNQGMIVWDADYVYVCVAANTWKRSPLTTW